jgi:hypothetical protein
MLRQLAARDWFDSIRSDVIELEKLRIRAEELQAQVGVKGQSFGAIGHASGSSDPSAKQIALIQAKESYERHKVALDMRLDEALAILYGCDNRGGLAMVRCSADADCICGYYLQAMSWRQVAEELVKPDSKDGPQWCKRRAYRSLELMDRLGFDYMRNI